MTRIKRDITDTEKRMGESLRALRRDKMTQVDLAERLKPLYGDSIAQSSVSDWETGRLRLHGDLIFELCQILETDPNTLLDTHHPRMTKSLTAVIGGLPELSKRKQDALANQIGAWLEEHA